MARKPRYIVEEINGTFYISLGRSLTREGQHIRVAPFATRKEAEDQITIWTRWPTLRPQS